MPRETPLVTCIVLNWNGWRDTLACLASVYQSNYPNLSVVVVDNGSADDSVQQIQDAFPHQEILVNSANYGFGPGNNRGIKLALSRGAEYVWLLNNDTLVEPYTLSAMVTVALEDPAAGQIGSVLYYAADPATVQAWGGGRVSLWTGAIRHFHQPVNEAEVLYLTAASVLLRGRTLEMVGLFDESYFMYFEDTDLSFRIRAAGWTLRVCETASVLHKEGVSSNQKSSRFDRLVTESGVRFLRRYAPVPIIPILIFVGGRAAKRLLQGRLDACKAILLALSKRTQGSEFSTLPYEPR